MKQIALYITNTDRSLFAQQRPSDYDRIKAMLEGVGAKYEYTVFDVVQGQFIQDPAAYDAVILGGSPADIASMDDWIVALLADIQRLVAAKLPMIGLCFGHQVIMAALGGRVENADFWIFGAVDTRIVKRPTWMVGAPDRIRLNAANHAQVVEIPAGFEILGVAENCAVALTAMGQNIFTTQFHPEIDEKFMADLIDEYGDQLGPQVCNQARLSLDPPAQGRIFGQWARDFIELTRP